MNSKYHDAVHYAVSSNPSFKWTHFLCLLSWRYKQETTWDVTYQTSISIFTFNLIHWGCVRIRWKGEYLVLRQETEEHCIMNSLMVCTVHERVMEWVGHEAYTWGRREMHTAFWWGCLHERCHFKNLAHGRLTLKGILKKYEDHPKSKGRLAIKKYKQNKHLKKMKYHYYRP